MENCANLLINHLIDVPSNKIPNITQIIASLAA